MTYNLYDYVELTDGTFAVITDIYDSEHCEFDVELNKQGESEPRTGTFSEIVKKI